MKINKFINILIAFLGISIAFSSCVKQNFTEPESVCNDNVIPVNTTIAQLKAMFTGDTLRINDSVVIEGIVTSCDKEGNFYKELVIEDESAAIGIQLDGSYLFTKYPLGQKVYVKAGGLYIAKDYGAIKLGALYTEYDIVQFGRIQGEVVYDQHIIKSCDNSPIAPQVVTLNQVNDNLLYKLIKIENVQFKYNELGTTYADAINLISVNHIIVDESARSLFVRVSGYAAFARDSLPEGNGSIVGVLEKYNSDYQLMIRSTDDVDFSNQRFAEPISKDFEDGNVISEGWTNYIVSGVAWTTNNQYSVYGSYYAQCKTYGTGLTTESWLISPKLDLSNFVSPFLNFQSAWNYSGPDLMVKYSTDYDGVSNPNTATWTALNPTFYTGSTSWTWADSGNMTIPNTTTYVAIIYTGTTSFAKTWEVDNILIDDSGK